jgi:hypothetical protein
MKVVCAALYVKVGWTSAQDDLNGRELEIDVSSMSVGDVLSTFPK